MLGGPTSGAVGVGLNRLSARFEGLNRGLHGARDLPLRVAVGQQRDLVAHLLRLLLEVIDGRPFA